MSSYFGTDPGDLTNEEMYGREPVPVPRPPEGEETPLLPSQMVEVLDRLAGAGALDRALARRFIAGLYREVLGPRPSSPSVPTAMQEQRDADAPEIPDNVFHYERIRLPGAGQIVIECQYCSTFMNLARPDGLWLCANPECHGPKPKVSAVSSSEEAANSDTPDGISLIAAERKRQVEARGWTAAHDDGHTSGELAKVAAAVATHHTDATVSDPGMALDDPWGILSKHDNSRNPIRCLTIAGALIAAEIDRLNRAARVQGENSQ